MAKRKKKTENKRILALGVYEGIFKAQPDFAEQVVSVIEDYKKQGAEWNEELIYCPISMFLIELKRWYGGDPDAKYFKKLRGSLGSLLAGMAAWDLSKVIYRFDPDFFEELKETEGLEQVPVDALMHMPYKCLCLQVGDESRLVFLDYDFDTKLYELRIETFEFDDEENRINETNYFLVLSSDKLQKCLEDSIESGLQNFRKTNLPELQDGFKDIYENNREVFQSTIQMILFIQSQNSDIVENEKNAEARRKYNRNRTGAKRIPKVLDSGYRIGAEIRRVKEINVCKEDPESAENVTSNVKAVPASAGSKKTPHVRRAHWHHYWTGSEKVGNRKLVIRWLPPMAIGSRSEGLAAVVHDVRKN